MKKLVFILLFLPAVAFSQDNDYWFPVPQQQTFFERIPEPVKVITIFVSSITLDAVSDAMIAQNKNTVLAHSLDAVNIGMLLSTPFILDIDKNNWFAYLTSYVCFRIALFDPIYNVTRGYPIAGERYPVSLWDKALIKVNPPPGAEIFARSMFLGIAITIPIKEIR